MYISRNSFNDKAAHNMTAFEPPPSKYNDMQGITEMHENFGII